MFYYCTIPLVISILLTFFIMPRLLLISHKKRLFDMPDLRKVHAMAIPRLGGITFFPIMLMSVFVTIICGVYFLLESSGVYITADGIYVQFLLFIVGIILLFFVGIMDDLVGVRYQSKFLAETIAALLFPIGGLWIDNLHGLMGINELSPFIGMPLTVILVIYVINAINLIDGIDGLASGISIIALGTFGGYSILARQNFLVILVFAMIGVLVAFWYINVFGNAEKGRKIFMGDTGSITLGYFISFIGLSLSSMAGTENLPVGMLLVCFSTLIIPLLDILRVMGVRILNHANPFLPDRNHIHHLMMKTGMRLRWVMVVLLMVSVLFIGITIIGVYYQWNLTTLLLVDVMLWMLLNIIVIFWGTNKNIMKQ